jgi:hypothetical protein
VSAFPNVPILIGPTRMCKDRLKRCQWLSMQLKREGIKTWRKRRAEWVNVSPASLCVVTESFS